MKQENKSEYNTKFSINEKVVVRNSFYKGTKGIIKDVEKNGEEYIYKIQPFTKQNGTIMLKAELLSVKEILLRKFYF